MEAMSKSVFKRKNGYTKLKEKFKKSKVKKQEETGTL